MGRARYEIERAARWWAVHRPDAPGAVRLDLAAAIALLVDEPAIGTPVKLPRLELVRRLRLPRVGHDVYYRVHHGAVQVVAFWPSDSADSVEQDRTV